MTTKQFRIHIYKARQESWGGVSIEMDIGGRNGLPTNVPVEGQVTDALAVATRLAAEYGKPCYASISLVKGQRTPPGFKEATKNLFFNLDQKDATDCAAA